MTDLNRFKIEQYRQCVAEDAFEDALCDMALRTHDAEQRVQRAEAECERLRRSLQNVMVHTGHTKTSPDRLHMELLDHIAQIVSNALTTPPPEKPQAPTIEELHEERKRWRPAAPHTPEQAHGDALAAFRRRAEELVEVFTTDEYIAVHDALTASGVPYVPEEVRRLPEDWMQQAGQARRCLNDGKSAVYESCSRQLDKALASAPAVLNRREIFYRLANYESDEPYEGGEDQPQFSYSRYVLDQWLVQDHRGDCTNEPFTCMRCFAERCWHKAGWIAAAPTDGRAE